MDSLYYDGRLPDWAEERPPHRSIYNGTSFAARTSMIAEAGAEEEEEEEAAIAEERNEVGHEEHPVDPQDEGDEEPHHEDQQDKEAKIPEGMLCPILLQIMRDPVVDPDGHSYDRNAIVEWLSRNSTSPKTRRPLRADQLVPNRALKETICQYLSEHSLLEGEEEI